MIQVILLTFIITLVLGYNRQIVDVDCQTAIDNNPTLKIQFEERIRGGVFRMDQKACALCFRESGDFWFNHHENICCSNRLCLRRDITPKKCEDILLNNNFPGCYENQIIDNDLKGANEEEFKRNFDNPIIKIASLPRQGCKNPCNSEFLKLEYDITSSLDIELLNRMRAAYDYFSATLGFTEPVKSIMVKIVHKNEMQEPGNFAEWRCELGSILINIDQKGFGNFALLFHEVMHAMGFPHQQQDPSICGVTCVHHKLTCEANCGRLDRRSLMYTTGNGNCLGTPGVVMLSVDDYKFLCIAAPNTNLCKKTTNNKAIVCSGPASLDNCDQATTWSDSRKINIVIEETKKTSRTGDTRVRHIFYLNQMGYSIECLWNNW